MLLDLKYRAFALSARDACDVRAVRRRGLAQSGEPIKIGYSMAHDRRARAQRQVRAARAEDLGGGHQCQGRAARPPGQAGLLRRPEQSVDGARHLHQAARRRQSRPDHRRLRHQHAGAGDAGRDAEEEDVHRPVRPRREQRVQLSELFRDDPVRAPTPKPSFTKGFFDVAHGAEPEAADGGDRRRRRGVRAQRLPTARARTRKSRPQDRLRQDAIRRRPPTSPRSCARSRRPTRTSS